MKSINIQQAKTHLSRLLEEIRDGIPGEELIGPAPLLRLRGRHRAQLVAKSTRPRRIVSRLAQVPRLRAVEQP